MQNGLFRSIAMHSVLHQPHGMAGAMGLSRNMGAMPTGGNGIIDRLTGSPLGQMGMALLMGGGGQLGGAAQALMQMQAMRAMAGPKLEHVGNTIGIVDPRTGQFVPTYTEPEKDDEDTRIIRHAGLDPNSPEGQAMYKAILDRKTDPIINVPLPASMGGGMYSGPQSGFADELQRLAGAKPAQATPGALAPPSAPSGLPAAITAQSESNGRDLNPDGSPVTSPKGAKFAMQVMPSTAHNPGFGITPAASDTPAEYDRVGNDYLATMAKRYGGDMSKAWAAYNAGPRRVDRALSNGPGWLSSLPAKTQAYVTKNMGALSAPASGGNDIVAQAQAAIAAGADPIQVRARAAQMGVTLP